MNNLWLLIINFLYIGLISIGGVSATLPEMHRILVSDLHLMNDGKFAELYALSQAAPGPNLLFVGLFGYEISGVSGAFASLLSLSVPTLLIAINFEKYGSKFHQNKFYKILKMTLAPIAIGLLLASIFLLIKSLFNWKILLFIILNLIILKKFKFNSIYLIILGAVLGGLGLFNI